MRIVHVAPFAPGRCGLYESAADLVRGERRLGHTAVLVDAGVPGEGANYGEEDHGIRSEPPIAACGADVLVTHTSPPDDVLRLARGAPRVHVIHGRPESSFRLSQKGGASPVYDLYATWAREGKVDRWVTLWPEHLPYWSAILPEDRLSCTSAPPCDLERWTPAGPKHKWEPGGRWNVLVADPWREDSDPYHVVHGLLLLAKRRPGVKVHLYACSTPVGPWEHLFRALRRADALGETKGMMRDIDTRYRAADLVVTPHRIATRIVREAAACGAPVLTGGQWGSYRCDSQSPTMVADIAGFALDNQKRQTWHVDVTRYDCKRIAAELVSLYESTLASVS